MDWLARDERVIFIGQAVGCAGTAMTGTLKDVPERRKIEMPVAEEMQMGASIGLALAGFLPVTIYPRWNFLLLSTNQIVNHLDKLPLMSGYRPKVIVRVGVGSERPLHPGFQHVGNFAASFREMCKTVEIVELDQAADILPAYKRALNGDGSTILVEHGDHYNER